MCHCRRLRTFLLGIVTVWRGAAAVSTKSDLTSAPPVSPDVPACLPSRPDRERYHTQSLGEANRSGRMRHENARWDVIFIFNPTIFEI